MIVVFPTYEQDLSGQPFEIAFSVAPAVNRIVTWNGTQWREFQCGTDCEMLVTGVSPGNCAIWLCGAGGSGGIGVANGIENQSSGSGGGGGGGYFQQYTGTIASAFIQIGRGEKGAIGGSTTVQMSALATMLIALGGKTPTQDAYSNGADGGSGGGPGVLNTPSVNGKGQPGQGGKVSTYPFLDTTNHNALCAGGSCGTLARSNAPYTGYRGGINGANGFDGTVSGSSYPTLGNTTPFGGTGCGARSSTELLNAVDCSYPGGGGGGGGYSNVNNTTSKGGAGGPGIVMIRVPLDALQG